MMRAPHSAAELLQCTPHLRPVMDAARRKLITVMVLLQDAKGFPTLPSGAGWFTLVGDDTDRSCGPAAFPGIERTLERATVVYIASGAPVPVAYAGGALQAIMGERVVFIDTRLEHHAAWNKLARRCTPDAFYVDVTPLAGGVQ